MSISLSSVRAVRKWALWSAPRSVILLVLGCAAATVVTSVWAASDFRFQQRAVINLGILLALSIGFQEVSSKVEKTRNRIHSARYVDMSSVWIFAAVMALPFSYAFLVVALLHMQLWLRVGRPASNLPHRAIFNVCTVWLACLGAHAALLSFPGAAPLPSGLLAIVAVLVSILAFTAVNASLVFAAVFLSTRPEPAPFRSIWQDSFLEFSTLCLAGLAGLALIFEPWLVVLIVPAMSILQRSVLVKELQEAATTDAKTGLLNAQAWHRVATVELERSVPTATPAALMIIDMDNFKLINDTYGHLAGDDVLKAVAGVLTDELRTYDSVGRFGGEEFVALLPKVDALDALAISDRVLQRIRDLRVKTRLLEGLEIGDLSASIGIACHPQQGSEVEGLLHLADSALYVAKREGRDRVEYSNFR